MQTMVLSRESISSVYAIVIPVRPLFATSSFTQSITGIHSDTVIGTALRRACGASCIRLVFPAKILSRFCHAVLNFREQQAILLKKMKKTQAKIAFFLFFRRKKWHDFVTPFSTFANINGSLPTYSTTPDRLRCRTRTYGEDFPGFWIQDRQNPFFQKVRHLVLIYTPKEAHSRIFVTGGAGAGGSVIIFARQMLAKKKLLLSRRL